VSLRTVHEHLWELGRSRRLAPDRPAEPGAMVVDPAHVLRFRARATRLDRRLPAGSWRDAAYGGLQDSAPRAALLALHARQEGTGPGSWEDPALVQVWFRWSDYVVPAADFAVFTLGVLPRDPERAAALEAIGAEVREALAGRELRTSEVRAVRPHLDRGVLGGASAVAAYRIRWDAPATADRFAKWAAVSRADARATWAALAPELVPVAVEGRARDVLARDVDALTGCEPPAGVRLLPQGDPYLALDQAWAHADRPPPPIEDGAGAPLTTRLVNSLSGRVLVDGRLAGAWGRERDRVAIHLWRRDEPDRERIAAEAVGFAGPIGRPVRLRWLR